MLKEIEISIDPKSELKRDLDLTGEMKETLEDYILSLHGISESSKETYISQVRKFGLFLVGQNIGKLSKIDRQELSIV